jgi:hypothetical protein
MNSFFGNGEIESLYTKNGNDYAKINDFDQYLEATTSAVANWLSEAHDGIYYTSAFEAISSTTIQAGDFDNLVACYNMNN